MVKSNIKLQATGEVIKGDKNGKKQKSRTNK
jgi:hypothetical protein